MSDSPQIERISINTSSFIQGRKFINIKKNNYDIDIDYVISTDNKKITIQKIRIDSMTDKANITSPHFFSAPKFVILKFNGFGIKNEPNIDIVIEFNIANTNLTVTNINVMNTDNSKYIFKISDIDIITNIQNITPENSNGGKRKSRRNKKRNNKSKKQKKQKRRS
jgi:hypothetical protein